MKDLAADAVRFGEAIQRLEPGAPDDADIRTPAGSGERGPEEWKPAESSEHALGSAVMLPFLAPWGATGLLVGRSAVG